MSIYHRILFYISGLFIISSGVSLTIIANFGTGAWEALNVGLTNIIGLTVGSWVIVVGVILTLLNGLLIKRKPEYLSIAAILVMGPLIDFWLIFVYKNIEPTTMLVKFTVIMTGIIIIGVGAAIYLQANFPVLPIDGLMLAIKERFSVSLMVAKTIGEVCALVLALIVKGPIGIGTILVTFAVGPFIQLFFPYFEKLKNRLEEANYKTKHAK